MRRLHIINSLCLSVGLCLSFLHADNTRQSVTKELLSKTLSGGITTLEWVVRYESNSSTPLENVIITDNFSSAQTYVPSTEAHPDGWSVTQNPNQFVWETSNGNSYSRPFPEPSGDLLVEGEGDGWAPIPYLSTTGQKRIYLINHHKDASVASFNCVGECNGIWPKQLPTGDGSGQSSPTSQATETVTIGNKLFYGVSRTSDSGIACYDMENDSECGYIQLSALGSAPGGKCIAVDGLQRIGNALYIMDGNAIVYKVSVTGSGTMSLAGSFDMTTLGMSTYRFTNPAISLYAIGSKVDGTKIYFSKGLPTGSGSIGCFDTATMSGCSGWGNVKSVPQMNDQGENTYFYYDNAMNKTAICVVDTSSTSRCFDLTTGTTVTRPEIFGSFSVNTSYAIGTELTVGTKTYFPSILEDDIFCYDWSTASPCSPDTIDDGTGRARNYAIALDAQGCAWVYGDTESATSSVSHLWSFDPLTGTQPCESGGELVIEDTYDASNNWCASENVEWRYTQFRIDNIDWSAFDDLNITFYDAAGNIIKTATLSSNVVFYSQELFTAPFTPGEPIHYKIEGTWSGNTGHYTPPIITIGVEGPPREFCFNTTVPCPVTGEITNHVEVKLKDDPIIDSSADVIEDAEALCLQAQPTPQQCLHATSKLTCTPAGWTIELNTFSPNTYNASNTDLQVIAPASATATKWGNTWYLNGVNPGDTLQLSMNGVQKGAGKSGGTDLCCAGDINLTIPQDQTCEVDPPHMYVRKEYDSTNHTFTIKPRIMSEIYAPQVVTMIDTIPAGITITGMNAASATEWRCTPAFPVSGPAQLSCTYIGPMPVSGIKEIILNASIDNTQMPAENCVDSSVTGTDGLPAEVVGAIHHCVEIPREENNTTDTNDSTCVLDSDCPQGTFCHQGYCASINSNTNDGEACDDGDPTTVSDTMVNGVCIGNPITCDDNNPCTEDTINPQTGACIYTPINESNVTGCQGICQNGTCVSPSTIIIPTAGQPNITLRKTAPKACRAGEQCTFTLTIRNKGTQRYSGPIQITDRSKEFVGKLLRDSSKAWRCKTTKKGYVCINPKVTLAPGASTRLKLTVRIPQHAKGYLHNCAKLDRLSYGQAKVMALQTVLQKEGFDPNGIDGGMGKGTKRALKDYMKNRGIKSQKRAIRELVENYPHVTSKNSCVKVKIKKSKIKCKPYERRIGDRCKPICKRWQHWSGQHCVSCPKGTKWDERKKRCREVKCKEGMTMVKGKCTKIQKSDKPKCIPFVTHYSPLLGICVPNVSIGIGGGGGGKPAGGGHPDVAP